MNIGVAPALNEIRRRLLVGRDEIVKGRFHAQRDLRSYGEHYLDGKLAGIDLALATVDQIRNEIVEEAERRQRAVTGQGFTKAKHR